MIIFVQTFSPRHLIIFDQMFIIFMKTFPRAAYIYIVPKNTKILVVKHTKFPAYRRNRTFFFIKKNFAKIDSHIEKLSSVFKLPSGAIKNPNLSQLFRSFFKGWFLRQPKSGNFGPPPGKSCFTDLKFHEKIVNFGQIRP